MPIFSVTIGKGFSTDAERRRRVIFVERTPNKILRSPVRGGIFRNLSVEWHNDAAPDGVKLDADAGFYKDVAPTALSSIERSKDVARIEFHPELFQQFRVFISEGFSLVMFLLILNVTNYRTQLRF